MTKLSPNRLIIFKNKNDNLRDSIINLIKCSICDGILSDPYDCQCCSMTYCFSCISEYVIKYKKCPNKIFLSEEDASIELKPTSNNLSLFINNLNFSCSNKNYGCSEELKVNNIILHELCCPNAKNDLDTPRSGSIMSFRNRNEQYESVDNNKEKNTNNALNDKLDKILEYFTSFESNLNNRNSLGRDYYTETPKFSININNKSDVLGKHMYNDELKQSDRLFGEIDKIKAKVLNFENAVCDMVDKKVEEKCNQIMGKTDTKLSKNTSVKKFTIDKTKIESKVYNSNSPTHKTIPHFKSSPNSKLVDSKRNSKAFEKDDHTLEDINKKLSFIESNIKNKVDQDSLINEIKNCFLEVILDSTNIYSEKFEEVLKLLKR